MRATILPLAIILTKARRATVSIMARVCIVAWVLPLRCFLFLLPNYIHISAIILQYLSYTDKGKYCNRNIPNTKYFPLLTSGGYKISFHL